MHLDLNLLLALDALLEEHSVGRAATRMHVTSPAMSRTLGRIRELTGDEVLVRVGRTMTPTPYALAVREEVHAIVMRAQRVLTARDELDLSSLQRVFTVRSHDAIAEAVAPALLSRMHRDAPGTKLRWLAEAPVDTDELRQGNIDLELSANAPSHRDVAFEVVARDELVVVMRRQHQLAQGTLTPLSYSKAEHVIISRRGRLRDPVDEALESHGLTRKVVASAPTTAAALRLVDNTDALVCLPQKMCAVSVAAYGLATAALPVPAERPVIIAAWHRRYETDRAHEWLRQLTKAVIREIAEEV